MWSSTLVCGAQLSQQCSEACFSYALEGGALHHYGSLDKCLGTLMASGEFSQEPICGWSCSADMAILVMCTNIVGASLPEVSNVT